MNREKLESCLTRFNERLLAADARSRPSQQSVYRSVCQSMRSFNLTLGSGKSDSRYGRLVDEDDDDDNDDDDDDEDDEKPRRRQNDRGRRKKSAGGKRKSKATAAALKSSVDQLGRDNRDRTEETTQPNPRDEETRRSSTSTSSSKGKTPILAKLKRTTKKTKDFKKQVNLHGARIGISTGSWTRTTHLPSSVNKVT